MSVRALVTAGALAALGACLAVAMVDLPPADLLVGPYGPLLVTLAVEEARTVNAVAAVLFDLRPSDTLGEALALFAASAGLQLVLRPVPGERRRAVPRTARRDRSPPPTSDAIRAVALGLVAPTAALAVFYSLRGHLSVGGGLQGGLLAAIAFAFVLLAGQYRGQRLLTPETWLDRGEAVSVGGYLLVGIAGLVVGTAFLENVLPVGEFGALLSSGTIVVLSLLVAVEAAAAVLLLFQEVEEESYELEGGP